MTKKTKPTLYIAYTSSRSGGQKTDPNDEWCFRRPAYVSLDIKGVYRSSPACFQFGALQVPAEIYNSKKIYLVVVRFSDGDTFGTTHGLHEFWAIKKTAEEAQAEKAKIESKTNSDDIHLPWTGYFSALEDVEIHEFFVR